MQDNAAYDLHGEMLHTQHTPARFTAHRVSVGQNIVKSFSGSQPVLEDLRLSAKLAVGHRSVFFLKSKHLIADRLHTLDLAVRIAAEYFFYNTHIKLLQYSIHKIAYLI